MSPATTSAHHPPGRRSPTRCAGPQSSLESALLPGPRPSPSMTSKSANTTSLSCSGRSATSSSSTTHRTGTPCAGGCASRPARLIRAVTSRSATSSASTAPANQSDAHQSAIAGTRRPVAPPAVGLVDAHEHVGADVVGVERLELYQRRVQPRFRAIEPMPMTVPSSDTSATVPCTTSLRRGAPSLGLCPNQHPETGRGRRRPGITRPRGAVRPGSRPTGPVAYLSDTWAGATVAIRPEGTLLRLLPAQHRRGRRAGAATPCHGSAVSRRRGAPAPRTPQHTRPRLTRHHSSTRSPPSARRRPRSQVQSTHQTGPRPRTGCPRHLGTPA